ncbi:hypothetical protein HK099_008629 [Clydaea vesicula]|uniref:Endonuclease/exonuclease/phosphatase domain-containing protein n=1 Tax=Clydaea vesicula TaxID=447962 RepID=A0AAD5XXP9_9FUNG|nr:hypothetical protein HK099_008629 [Clydaea vesicula]
MDPVRYSEIEVEAKVNWTSAQLQRMNCAIVAFEEVYDLPTLNRAVVKAGYPKDVNLISTPMDGKSPCVAFLSIYKILSKRPMMKPRDRFDHKAKAKGHALSLLVRGAEAAALRCLLVDELIGLPQDEEVNAGSRTGRPTNKNLSTFAASSSKSRSRSRSVQRNYSSTYESPTVIVIGDLNDTGSSVSTEIIKGTKPWKTFSDDVKAETWKVLLHEAREVQLRSSDRDVSYSHIHNGKYEVLDHILVSNNLVRDNPDHIGYVQWIQYFTDHIYDETLVDREDEDHGPLSPEQVIDGKSTHIFSPKITIDNNLSKENNPYSNNEDDDDDDWEIYDHPFGPPSPSTGFNLHKNKPRKKKQNKIDDIKLLNRGNIKSDHATVCCLLKIWALNTKPPKVSRENTPPFN